MTQTDDGAGAQSSIHEPRSESATLAVLPTVLQVLPALVTGGVERGTVDIAAALVAAGWTALVASAGGPMVREIERAGARHLALPLDTKNPIAISANVGRLKTVIAEYGIDIVHARSRAPAWSALYAARHAGAHFLTTFHGAYSAGSWFKRRYNAVMTRGERVIAISDFIAGEVTRVYGLDPERVRVVHRGVDFDIFDPTAVSAERLIQLAQAWRLPDGVRVVMLPGRLARWKGHAVLIEALARLGRRDIVCVLVGEDRGRDRYRRELERLIAKRGVQGLVQIAGHCRDMAAAFMLADVVVSASTHPEAFGRVVAESQAMGRPVIAGNHGAAQETIIAGVTGWLVPPGNPAALAEALAKALALDSGDRERIARHAIDHIHERFSKEAMNEATLAVYREVMAGDSAQGEQP